MPLAWSALPCFFFMYVCGQGVKKKSSGPGRNGFFLGGRGGGGGLNEACGIIGIPCALMK